MARHGDDQAASSILSWIVGVIIFSASLATVLSFERSPLTSADTEDEDLRTKAANTLDLILTTPGQSENQGAAWEKEPDNLVRFGLQNGSANFLDYEKIKILRKGGLTASSNSLPDYPEVKGALSLENYDFHLRTFPILHSVEDAEWTQYRGIRAAYLGHFEEDTVEPTANITYASDASPTGYTQVSVTVEPTDGPTPTVYQVTLDLDTGDGHNVQNLYTPLISVGETATVSTRYYDLDWPGGDGNYGVTVTVSEAATGDVAYEMTHQAYLNVDPTRDYSLLIEPTKSYYYGTEQPALILDKWEEDGSRHRADGISVDWAVTDDTGNPVDSGTVTLPKNKESTVNVDMGTHGTGTYDITLTDDTGITLHNRFTITSSNLDSFTYLPSVHNQHERGYLETLFEDFNNNTYYEGDPEGDVFRDHQNDAAALGSLLDRYDVLLIGSLISQSQLQGQFKHDVRDWVLDGGTLIALGTERSNVQWMKSIFGSGSHTATGGISTPDPNHPMLTVPEKLNYRDYNDHDRSYKIDGSHEDKFTHVILKNPDNPGGSDDVMAISNPGAYGDGTVIVTSYIPSDLQEPYDPTESLKLLHNLVTQGFNMLFLDYGPAIPDKASVGSASRLAVIPHPEVEGILVETHIIMYMFR